MITIPAGSPEEFRRDVVRLARKGEAPLSQIAKDFGIAEGTPSNWLKRADIDDGIRSGVTTTEAAELREAKMAHKLLEQENEILRRAATYFAVTCRVLGFSTQAFNKWGRNPVSQRDWGDAHLINAALDIHGDDPAFGYRFIADELRDAGHQVSERWVWRICSEPGIWSVFSKKRTSTAGPDHLPTTTWWSVTSPPLGPTSFG